VARIKHGPRGGKGKGGVGALHLPLDPRRKYMIELDSKNAASLILIIIVF
jgi:hypothetical protein